MQTLREAVIVDALRTPIARIRGGLSAVRSDDLLAHVLQRLVDRTGVDPAEVDEVFAGCANQAGEDNRNVARMAWLIAGFPYEVPCITVNRLCASGLDAIVQAVRAVQVGDHDVVIAGGVESMTRAPLVMAKAPAAYGGGNRQMFDSSLGWRFPNPRLEERFPLEGMGETAENIAERYGIGRAAQDRFALSSHEKAIAAWEEGRFADEIVAVEVVERNGSRTVDRDEGPRADTNFDKLSQLRAVFRQGGTVTAGNSSTLNDGAAAVLITSAEAADRLGLSPLARVVGCASAGVDPRVMGLGPIPAARKALSRAGLAAADLDLIELNEAFAVQTLAVVQDLQLPIGRVNVNGGAIALGHPLGCSGARIMTTLVHEMRRRGAATGLATLCVGVGQGVAVVVQNCRRG